MKGGNVLRRDIMRIVADEDDFLCTVPARFVNNQRLIVHKVKFLVGKKLLPLFDSVEDSRYVYNDRDLRWLNIFVETFPNGERWGNIEASYTTQFQLIITEARARKLLTEDWQPERKRDVIFEAFAALHETRFHGLYVPASAPFSMVGQRM